MNIKKSISISFLIAFGFLLSAKLTAQDCKFFFPTEKGTVLETVNYDKKGKVIGYISQKILDNKQEGDAQIVTFEQSSRDAKGENKTKSTFEVKCEDGKFYFGLDDYFEDMNLNEYEENPEMEVVVDGDGLYFPGDLEAGEQLPDGSITVKVMTGGVPMITMTVTVSNRKVDADESVTTPAGTFECYKISQDVEMKAIMRIRMKETQWIAEGVGIVKSETYDKKGKLMDSSELVKITKE